MKTDCARNSMASQKKPDDIGRGSERLKGRGSSSGLMALTPGGTSARSTRGNFVLSSSPHHSLHRQSPLAAPSLRSPHHHSTSQWLETIQLKLTLAKMLARNASTIARRGFSTSRTLNSGAHYAEGPGSNIPFNPKTRFFWLRYWGFMSTSCSATQFLAAR